MFCGHAAQGLDVSALEPVVGPLPEFPPPYLQLQVKLHFAEVFSMLELHVLCALLRVGPLPEFSHPTCSCR
jgi:hypothetical protein